MAKIEDRKPIDLCIRSRTNHNLRTVKKSNISIGNRRKNIKERLASILKNNKVSKKNKQLKTTSKRRFNLINTSHN